MSSYTSWHVLYSDTHISCHHKSPLISKESIDTAVTWDRTQVAIVMFIWPPPSQMRLRSKTEAYVHFNPRPILFTFLSSITKSRRLRWAGHVARMEEGRSAFKILTGKPTGKRTLGKPRRRREENIWMDLEEIGINVGNWVDSAQDKDYWRAFVNAALNLGVP